MAYYESTSDQGARANDDVPAWWLSNPPQQPYSLGMPDLTPLEPPPCPLFYFDDAWHLVPAPPDSVPITEFDRYPTLLRQLLSDSIPTSIPDHFVGAIHARPCRQWQGYCTERGYGVFFGAQRGRPCTLYAHRLRLAVRDGCLLPSAMHARHLCNNSRCIEVSHLAWGTLEQNTRDRDMKQALHHLDQVRRGNLAPAIAAEIRNAVTIYGLDIEGIQRLTRLPLSTIEELLAASFVAL